MEKYENEVQVAKACVWAFCVTWFAVHIPIWVIALA